MASWLSDLVNPFFNVFETFRIRDWVHKDNSMGSFIKRFSDISEPLLTSSIPDIQRDGNPIDLDSFDFEIHSDCAEIFVLESVFAVA